MERASPRPSRVVVLLLAPLALLFALLSVLGMTWGLPSRDLDAYLFGSDEPWPGEKIYRLAGAGEKGAANRGADVDVDPLRRGADEPLLLTATEEDVAKIYLRYRLYTHQPDEMITMMALAGMNPRRLQLDPRLYQYGGLFLYPVGGLIAVAGSVGLIDVRNDVAYYLDHPDEFGKFYVVARAYAAAWGLIGVAVVFAIARRLGGTRAGLLAAFFFTLLPVVVCMAHEGKPHLPGAVLMLAAVLFAMRYAEPSMFSRRDWWLMCVCCGAAIAMVLSSWPILILIPWAAWRAAGRRVPPASRTSVWKRATAGFAVAVAVYLAANPYIVINAFTNRDVLRSNFGNSLAMYEITRIGEGFLRVLALTAEGATLPVLVLGTVALGVALARRNGLVLPLAVPAAVFFLQFVLIGAGKPAEYGRFGIFTNTALAIASACLLTRRWTGLRDVVNWIPAAFVLLWVGLMGGSYLRNFRIDATGDNSRTRILAFLGAGVESGTTQRGSISFALSKEPAPYCCPPLNFARHKVFLTPSPGLSQWPAPPGLLVFVDPVDRRSDLRGGPRRLAGTAAPTVPDDFSWKLHLRPEGDSTNVWRPTPQYLNWVIGLDRKTQPKPWHRLAESPMSWANKPFDVTVLQFGGHTP